MEKWDDWRIGLVLQGVRSELALYWPVTSTAPLNCGGSTGARSLDPAEIGLEAGTRPEEG